MNTGFNRVGGGYGYKGPWQCEPGFTCSPAPYGSPGNSGSSYFPEYLCTPDPGTIAPPYVYYVPQYGQCKHGAFQFFKSAVTSNKHRIGGGQGYSGPTDCLPPYICTASSQYFSQCEADPSNAPPPPQPTPTNSTPNLADPGSYCKNHILCNPNALWSNISARWKFGSRFRGSNRLRSRIQLSGSSYR
jgi:hypothetical protein